MATKVLVAAVGGGAQSVTTEGPQIACMERRVFTWLHTAIDGAASDEIDIIVGMLPADLSHVIRRVTFCPFTALTHHASNFLTLNLTRLDLAGAGSGDVIATISTDAADWGAFASIALTVDPAFSTWNYPPESPQVRGTQLRLACAKSGAGVKLPQGALSIEYDVTA